MSKILSTRKNDAVTFAILVLISGILTMMSIITGNDIFKKYLLILNVLYLIYFITLQVRTSRSKKATVKLISVSDFYDMKGDELEDGKIIHIKFKCSRLELLWHNATVYRRRESNSKCFIYTLMEKGGKELYSGNLMVHYDLEKHNIKEKIILDALRLGLGEKGEVKND